MKTFIWKFPFCHPLHKPTLGKTKKEARKEAWFDFFQQHTYEKKPTSLLPTFIPFLHVFTHWKLFLKRLMRTVKNRLGRPYSQVDKY